MDSRIEKFARILVDYSTRVGPGDKVAIWTSTAAEPLAQALYTRVLDRGGYPHVLFDMAEQDEILFRHANQDQLAFLPMFHKIAFEETDVLIKARADPNTRALTNVPNEKAGLRQRTLAPLIQAQMRRGAEGKLRWMSTQFPTRAYAMESEMGFEEYQDFFYQACHADDATPDPVAHWQKIQADQQRYVERFKGHDKVEIHGPHAELTLSVKDRIFLNASGQVNLPDGEIFTGPVEESVNGWVRYTYPAMYNGRVVEGVELTFQDGKVVKAAAAKNDAFLQMMLEQDPGARYLGEFAIGLNYEINRFTKSILFDEKIGGSFHTALGASYPETGGRNRSVIHWDLICDMRTDSEIRLDGETIYRNGQFLF